ncbi:unnamed protein product [Caenorhabditis angaria]|uniref:F-box domain-containing protein n=1 Tax=Caenorhabditis angaria TaxID=860376 RepID=A0A9P1I901_9PELO|nr:unnamed protein product [Caenorhabditis angaria]
MEEPPCYILSLPNELQEMIFDRMQPADKISFGKSSLQCRKLWEHSKSLYDGICWDNEEGYRVRLSLNNSYPFVGNQHFIDFHRDLRDYEVGQNDEITRTGKIGIQENSFEIAQTMFIKKLEKYQNTVKSLTIKGTCEITLQNVQSFPNLQYLYLSGSENREIFQEILSKTGGNMLKNLRIFGDYGEDYSEFQQIYRVREYLSIGFWLTREQFFNLSARNIEMEMGELKAGDIFEFIRTWQNGNRVLENCTWHLKLYDFDAREFFGFFNTQLVNHRYKQISIQGDGLTSAMITFKRRDCLTFEVMQNHNLFLDDLNSDHELAEVLPEYYEFERELLDLEEDDDSWNLGEQLEDLEEEEEDWDFLNDDY